MNRQKKIFTTIIVILLIILIPLFSVYVLKRAETNRINRKIPSYSFINQSGDSISGKSLRGKVYLASFTYTRCPSDEWKEMWPVLKSIQDTFKDEADFEILTFTIDPDYDTPERMMHFADSLDIDLSNWHFLFGTKREVYPLIIGGFMGKVKDGKPETGNMKADEKIAIVNRTGSVRGYYAISETKKFNKCLKGIRKLLDDDGKGKQ